MTPDPDERDPVAILLRSLPTPEPSPDFLAGARRRYAQALDARYRREALVALVAASAGLALAASLLLIAFEPAALIGSGAVAAANATRWLTGAAAVLSIVSPAAWVSGAAVSIVSLLPIMLLARMRWPAAAK